MEYKENNTNQLIYVNKLTDIENKLTVTKGERRWGGINEEYGINRYTPLHIKYVNNEDLLYSNRELYSVSCNNL